MNWNRRSFLQQTSILALGAGFSSIPLEVLAKYEIKKLTILHTNDQHSRIEPFPLDGGKFQGLGGVSRRAEIINQIRQTEENVLLLDAGDIFQGTPYFNEFHGELEFKLMNEMGYDASTIGNHDFDAGIDGLAKQIDTAQFSMINCNYDIHDTVLHNKILPYKIFKKNGIKIGVTGVGIELKGLVMEGFYGNTQYQNPIDNVNKIAHKLKNEHECDIVICLSHLGYKYESNKISDCLLATQTQNIDVIIGGHTHTLLPEPIFLKNIANQSVVVNQVGWAGIALGRIDFYFEKNFRKKCISCKPVIIST